MGIFASAEEKEAKLVLRKELPSRKLFSYIVLATSEVMMHSS